jgi:hypothetical protein
VIAFVKTTGFLEGFSTKERSLLDDDARSIGETSEAPPITEDWPHQLTRCPSEVAIAANDIGQWVCLEFARDSPQASRHVKVIRIQIPQDLAGRMPKSFVEGSRGAAIGFRTPISQPVFVSPNDLNAFICGAAVYYDVLQVRIAL